MKKLKKLTFTQGLVIVVLALLQVAIPIVINLATESPPQFVKDYSWLPSVILALLTIIYVVFSILLVTESDSGNQSDEPMIDEGTGSPYIVGPAIQDPAHFFGHQAKVNRFFDNLNGPLPQPLQVLGIRRAGKTSFLRYVSHPEMVRKNVRDAAKTLVIYIDLQADIQTVADFYMALAEGINGCLPTDNTLALPKEGFPTRRPFLKLLDSPQLKGYRLIFLLDEFEALRDPDAFDANFFKGLRALVNRPLAWVTTSYRDLYRLSRILGESEKTSPFFNIFHPRPIILGGLTEEECDELIQKPIASHPINFSPKEIVSIKKLAGPLPFFLQIAADAWFKAKQQGQERFEIEREVKQELATTMRRNFQWYWRHFDKDERELLKVIALEVRNGLRFYRQKHGDAVLNDLLRYGLITREGNKYRIASEVFAEWISRDRGHITSSD